MASLLALWARRSLFLGFVRRDIATRYTGTLVGGLWAIGQPVMLLAIYAFVFRRVFRVELPDLGANSFVAFVACGLWPWMAFQESVQRATHAITSNADLVRKVRFPYEFLVLAGVTSSFIIHFAGFCGVLLALRLWGEPLHLVALPTVLAAWALIFMLALALALLTSSLQVILKDVDHLMGPAFMLLFYATPILYPLALVPEVVRPWMEINPLLPVIEPLRAALLRGEGALLSMLPLLALAVLLVLAARYLFGRLSAYFEDFL